MCHTCYDITGAVASVTHTLPSGILYTGDINLLDPDCSQCNETGTISCIKTKTVCKLDDVNGDSINLVPYEEEKCLSNTGVWSTIGTYRNCEPYTVNNEIDPNSVGLPANGKSGRYILNPGNLWSPSSSVESYTIRVEGVSVSTEEDTYNNGGEYIDSYGRVTPLADGELSSWSWSGVQSDGVPKVTAGNKKIIITYTSL